MVRICDTMLSCSHQTSDAASSSLVGGCESEGGYVGNLSGCLVTPGADGLLIWPRCPRYKISDLTLLFHAPKSERPLRRGICVTEGKVLVVAVAVGIKVLVTGGGREKEACGC